jgi:hypothetical protein
VTAGCAFGSIVSVWLLVGAEVIDVEVVAFEADFTTTPPAPQAAVAKTDTVNPATIRFRFINAVFLPRGWPACYTTDFLPILG